MRTISVTAAMLALMLGAGIAQAATLEVSYPIQLTNDSYYERGPSVTYGGGILLAVLGQVDR